MTASLTKTGKQLNLFALTPETHSRFILFIAAALTISALFANYLYIQIIFNTPMYDFMVSEANDLSYLSDNISEGKFLKAEDIPRIQRLRQLALTQLGLKILLPSCITSVAFLVYYLYPQLLRKRKALMPFKEDIVFLNEIQDISKRLGIPTPNVEIDKIAKRTIVQVFGSPPYTIAVGQPILLLMRKRPDVAKAILTHELAHIANGDVKRTYLAQSFWWSLIVIGCFPVAIIMVVQYIQGIRVGFLPTYFFILSQFIITFCILILIRANLLRVRELYADWRAGSIGEQEGLSKIFTQQVKHINRARSDINSRAKPNAYVLKNIFKTFLAQWKKIWWLHPTPTERLRTINDSNLLVKTSSNLPFIVGILCAMVASGLFQIGSALEYYLAFATLPTMNLMIEVMKQWSLIAIAMVILYAIFLFLPLFFAIFIPAYLVYNTLGTQIQSEIIGNLAVKKTKNIPYLRMLIFSLLFVTGLLFGFLVTPYDTFTSVPDYILLDIPLMIIALTAGRLLILLFIVTAVVWIWLIVLCKLIIKTIGYHVSPPSKAKKLVQSIALSFSLTFLIAPTLAAISYIMRIPMGNPGLQSLNSAGPTLTLYTLLWFVIFFIGGLFVSVLIISIILIFNRRNLRKRKRYCASCGAIIQTQIAIGEQCQCNADLSPWIYI